MHVENPGQITRRASGRLTRNGVGLSGMLVLAVALVGIAMSMQASPADARSDGCTYTNFPDKYVCFIVNGESTHVDSFVAVRGKIGNDNGICNFQARFWGTAPDGSSWSRNSSYRSGCQVVRATRFLTVNRDFRHGSRVCGSFYENGVLQGTACKKIYR